MKIITINILLILCTIFASCNASKTSNESSLQNTEWSLITMTGANLSVSGKPLTLKFIDEVKAGGFAGCNNYFASYKTEDNKITFSDIGATRMFCEGTQPLENAFLESLRKSTTYNITDSRLIIKSKDVTLTFGK